MGTILFKNNFLIKQYKSKELQMKKNMCRCRFCGKLFPKSPRHEFQDCCQNKDCQKAKKREWQKNKMKTDPDYKKNQKDCNKRWREANPDYWKKYRKKKSKVYRKKPYVATDS